METSWPMPSLMALDFSDAALQQRAEADRREADPRSRSRRLPGRTPARRIWWVKNGRHGGVEYAGQTVGNAGSKLLIFDRLPALRAGAVSHTLLRAPAPPAGRATVTRPTQQAGLRSSLGRSTFHCVNMNFTARLQSSAR